MTEECYRAEVHGNLYCVFLITSTNLKIHVTVERRCDSCGTFSTRVGVHTFPLSEKKTG